MKLVSLIEHGGHIIYAYGGRATFQIHESKCEIEMNFPMGVNNQTIYFDIDADVILDEENKNSCFVQIKHDGSPKQPRLTRLNFFREIPVTLENLVGEMNYHYHRRELRMEKESKK
ncbi:hypothetical protein EAb13_CDS0015 [Acinetobacter phage EAb13]|nr:hypothetical protein EAb13_CDS0015 [Acinetobacter phage EAb13]